MIRDEFLHLLRCPEQRTSLALVAADVVQRLNQTIAEGRLCNRVGQTIHEPLEGALVRADHTIAYPIRGGIPVLLLDEGFPLDAGSTS